MSCLLEYEYWERHPFLAWIVLPWFFVIVIGGWMILAAAEQCYMALKGYRWDRHDWGYIHRKTGERKRSQPW
ncbi:MAG: hypothetical protein ACW99F_03815 [Candidatus Hodarchaeales archaeon]